MTAPVPTASTRPPWSIVVASALVALEGLTLVGLTVAELWAATPGRLTLGLSTAAFFAIAAAAVLWCAWGVRRAQSWSRGPVMMVQLIQLGMAYSLFEAGSPWITLALVTVALAVAVTLLHPRSLAAMSEDDAQHA